MEAPYEAFGEGCEKAQTNRTSGLVVKSLKRAMAGTALLASVMCGTWLYYDIPPSMDDATMTTMLNTNESQLCSRFTDGSCRLLPCNSWRGRTQCVGPFLQGICKCAPGYCANVWGVCVPPEGTCPADSGGTCRILGCPKKHGPTDCVDGKCICKPGTCANSKLFCDRPPSEKCPSQTGMSCRIFGCGAWRGPTKCEYGQCLCEDGQCASVAGICQPPHTCDPDTGGNCKISYCEGARGPTTCTDGTCACKPGYCAKDSGVGYGVCEVRKGQGEGTLSFGPYKAKVAAVNQEQPVFPSPHNEVEIALCISGGGARALSWAMGAFRALEDLKLMGHVDAISSVSGGTWASSIYMFADVPTEELLGKPTPPEEVTLSYIHDKPAALGAVVTTGYTTFLENHAASKLRPEDAYIDYVAETFLGPFGLGDRTSFMAGSAEDVERIKQANPGLRQEEFLTPVPGRPKVFVMGGMLGPPVGFEANASNAVLFQMSPDYTGSPFFADNKELTYEPIEGSDVPPGTVLVGGGLVESFAFGGEAPEDQSEGYHSIPPPRRSFSLAKAAGISSMGPSLDLSHRMGLTSAIPRGKLWPVTDDGTGSLIHELGDAGNMENSGLLAMLQRGVKKAAMWINTPVPIGMDYDFCAPDAASTPYDGEWIKDKVDVIFSALFGSGVDTIDDGFLKHNQVFPQADLAPTMCAFQELKKAGKPLVYRTTYAVQANSWWGIPGGWDLQVVMNYAEKSAEFESRLPEETQQDLPENYPYYDTGLYLTKKQVNILAAQSEYAVRENEHFFREILCPDGLKGFLCRHPPR